MMMHFSPLSLACSALLFSLAEAQSRGPGPIVSQPAEYIVDVRAAREVLATLFPDVSDDPVLILPGALKEMFDLLDQDSNGVVTPSEVMERADVMGMSLEEEKVTRMFAALDADRSGSFTFEEMSTLAEQGYLGSACVDDSDCVAYTSCASGRCESVLEPVDRRRL